MFCVTFYWELDLTIWMAIIFQDAFLSNSKQNWMEHILRIIFRETNIAPENGYLEDEFPAFLLGAGTSV